MPPLPWPYMVRFHRQTEMVTHPSGPPGTAAIDSLIVFKTSKCNHGYIRQDQSEWSISNGYSHDYFKVLLDWSEDLYFYPHEVFAAQTRLPVLPNVGYRPALVDRFAVFEEVKCTGFVEPLH
jgi:hypothetical protein